MMRYARGLVRSWAAPKSVCLPRAAVEPKEPSAIERAIGGGDPGDMDALREGPAGKYLKGAEDSAKK